MQVTALAVAAFQAGHEGSIPFARSNEKSQVSLLSSSRMVIIYGVGCSPAGHKRATGRTSDALASLAGRPGSHLVHQPAEGLRDGLITVPGGMPHRSEQLLSRRRTRSASKESTWPTGPRT
jgi:hypothetical protein